MLIYIISIFILAGVDQGFQNPGDRIKGKETKMINGIPDKDSKTNLHTVKVSKNCLPITHIGKWEPR